MLFEFMFFCPHPKSRLLEVPTPNMSTFSCIDEQQGMTYDVGDHVESILYIMINDLIYVRMRSDTIMKVEN